MLANYVGAPHIEMLKKNLTSKKEIYIGEGLVLVEKARSTPNHVSSCRHESKYTLLVSRYTYSLFQKKVGYLLATVASAF